MRRHLAHRPAAEKASERFTPGAACQNEITHEAMVAYYEALPEAAQEFSALSYRRRLSAIA